MYIFNAMGKITLDTPYHLRLKLNSEFLGQNSSTAFSNHTLQAGGTCFLLIGSASVWKVLETKPRIHFAHRLAFVLCKEGCKTSRLQGSEQEASAGADVIWAAPGPGGRARGQSQRQGLPRSVPPTTRQACHPIPCRGEPGGSWEESK